MVPASLSCRVIAMSCELGSREPDGWLWTQMIDAARSVIASAKTSRGWTRLWLTRPIVITRLPGSSPAPFCQMQAKCSCRCPRRYRPWGFPASSNHSWTGSASFSSQNTFARPQLLHKTGRTTGRPVNLHRGDEWSRRIRGSKIDKQKHSLISSIAGIPMCYSSVTWIQSGT